MRREGPPGDISARGDDSPKQMIQNSTFSTLRTGLIQPARVLDQANIAKHSHSGFAFKTRKMLVRPATMNMNVVFKWQIITHKCVVALKSHSFEFLQRHIAVVKSRNFYFFLWTNDTISVCLCRNPSWLYFEGSRELTNQRQQTLSIKARPQSAKTAPFSGWRPHVLFWTSHYCTVRRNTS